MNPGRRPSMAQLLEQNLRIFARGAVLCTMATGFAPDANAFDLHSIGGVSIRELLELREVSVAELADIAAPAIIELPAPEPVVKAPILAVATDIQIKVSPTSKSPRTVADAATMPRAVEPPRQRVSTLRPGDADSVNGVTHTLKVSLVDGQLRVVPEALLVHGLDVRVSVSIGDTTGTEPLNVGTNTSLFVRDQDVAEWDIDAKEFVTRGPGQTEIYVVASGRMQIVPITVTQRPKVEAVAANFESPATELDGIQSATAKGLEAPTDLMNLAEERRDKSVVQASYGDAQASDAAQVSDANGSTSVDQNAATATTTHAEQSANESEETPDEQKYFRDLNAVGYATLSVQVIDDRSSVKANRLYPVAGVNVRIAGTEYLGKTDTYGRVTIKDVPRNSRFYVTTDDPYGRVRPSYMEVVTPARVTGEIPIKVTVMRQQTFDAMTEIAGVSQAVGAASVCGRALSKETKQALAGIAIRTDVPGEGPYYFNSFGLLDPAMITTGADGRFCIFNLEPGPVMLSFIEDQDVGANVIIPTFAGRHLEDSFELGEEAPIVAGIASVSPVEDQLGADSIAANKLLPLEFADLIAIGDQQSLERKNFGVLSGRGAAQSYHGQSLVVSQSSVFEPAIYSFPSTADPNRDGGPLVVPLLPRGFIEDMSVFAQTVQDPNLGSVVIEHAVQDALGKEPLTFRLVSDSGDEVGTGWYYADFPVAKAIFFNVPPGNYSIIVETGAKFWISSTTATVYSEHAAVVSTGKRVRQQAERYSVQNH